MLKPTITPTDEQQKVIDHRGGYLLVIACAGQYVFANWGSA